MIETSTSSGSSVYFSGTYIIIELIIVVLGIVGLWMTFSKAGRPGWGAIIPFYNTYLMIKVAGRPGWWLILMFIPFVNLVILIIVSIDIAKNFEHGAGFGVLLWLFPFIMYLVLGFGSSKYAPVRT
jgi:hypothetical protein